MMLLEDIIAEQAAKWHVRRVFPKSDDERAEIESALVEHCISDWVSWVEGVQSFSIRSWSERWVVPWTDVPAPMTAWEIAGALARALNRLGSHPRGRARHTREDWLRVQSGDVWHYYFIRPGKHPGGVLLDIRSAYWQIYSAFPTWDMAYQAGEYIGEGEVPWPDGWLQWLKGQRPVRNGIVGVAGSTWTEVHHPDGRILSVPVHGVTNYQLVLLVLDTLQAVLWYTHRRFRDKVVYANTDSVMVSASEKDVLDYWRQVWGLEGVIKGEGEMELRDIGAYRIGDLVSGHFGRVSARPGMVRMHAKGLGVRIAPFIYEHVRPYLLEARK